MLIFVVAYRRGVAGYSKDVVTLIFVGRVEPFLHARDTVGWVGGSWISVTKKLDDGWPESEKDVFQAALSMVVVKNSR